MLPPERRLGDVLAQIDDHRFFPLHPGRKTGKATSLMWLEDHLNGVGRCRAVWVDLEMAREQPDVARAMTAVLDVIDRALAQRHPEIPRPEPAESGAMLTRPEPALLASAAPRQPRAAAAVLLFDEADGLVDEAMVAFLTQLRHGYIERSRVSFPSTSCW